MVALSIIIVTYNPGERISEDLRPLMDAAGAPETEVIVVDNASTDGTPARIRRDCPAVQLIANTENKGFSAANNDGFRLSSGQYLVFVNPDLLLKSDTLNGMKVYLDQHPDVGIVGPKTVDEQGHVSPTARPPYTLGRVIVKYLGLDRLLPGLVYGAYLQAAREQTEPFDVGWLQGSCLMVRREVYQQVGGFDDGFFLYVEDADLCQRIIQAGWRAVFLPDAVATHYGGTTTGRYPLIRVRHYHLSPLHYFRKQQRPAAVGMLKIVFTIELLSKILLRRGANLLRPDEQRRTKAAVEWMVLGEVWRY